jgi:hypothetical protein
VELNIGPAGELDYDAEFRRGFDFCIASVHDHFDLDRAAQTRRVVTAMHDPAVRMIGHLSARMIGGRPPIELDLDAVVAAAEETETALEVNGGLPRLDMSVHALQRAKSRSSKVTFVLTSDAHHYDELERVRYAALNAERAWIETDRVANARGAESLLSWVRRASTALAAGLLVLGAARTAGADNSNPNLIPLGETEAFLGNAGVARANDTSRPGATPSARPRGSPFSPTSASSSASATPSFLRRTTSAT